MTAVFVGLGCFALGLVCMSLLASAKIGDLELELARRSHREMTRAVLDVIRAPQEHEEELIEKAS